MSKTKGIPARDIIAEAHKWNLSKLFKSDTAWEKAYKKLEGMIPTFATFQGRLGESATVLRECCDFENTFEQLAEKLGVYAFLKSTENVANSHYQGMIAQYTFLMTQAAALSSFIPPEIQAIPPKKIAQFLKEDILEPYRFNLEKLLRYRPHILSENEERLLAMQGEVAGATSKIFDQLNDADLTFGFVTNEDGEKVELSQSSFRSLLESPKRAVRKKAFTQFYDTYEQHKNTLSATLNASVLQDVYQSRVRNYPTAREAALFSDKVPVAVYDNLIETVHKHLPTVYRYLDVRQKALRLKELHAYDTYAPIVKRGKTHIPYEDAVTTICDALHPLGKSYVNTLKKGLLEQRWVDRYENKGKRSGAFSYGCYGTLPYIMMNYKEDVIDSMFTLAHEGGHSMHTHSSNKAQPPQYSHYTIFVAEVASTFNEQLLSHHLLDRATDKKERAWLINREIDEIRGTIVRQTMFAEYEQILHEMAEEGQPLTVDSLREEYGNLLRKYFGENFVIDENLDLEGLRIPHFYSAFYVYKYATGLSAAIALSQAVLNEGKPARDRYLRFLQSGGSQFPLAQLREAGVDLEQPQPVESAMNRLATLVDELETLL